MKRCAARGLTLIELLVAMTLGLLIVVATISGYLGLSEAVRTAEAQARMDEDAQAALAILTAQLRMAGSNPDRPNRSPSRNPLYPTPLGFPLRGCDGSFANVATAGSIQDLTCSSGSPTAPDSIAITYEADRYNTVSPPPGFQPADCIGYPLPDLNATVDVIDGTGPAVPTLITFHAVDNRFYIASSGPTESPSLYCKGNGMGSIATPLVENVEDLQLSYGTVPATASQTSTANIAGYLDASELITHSALSLLPDDATRWEKVATVRVCLVVRSAKPLSISAGSAHYVKCDGTLETHPPDSRLRRAYSTTVVLRNRR